MRLHDLLQQARLWLARQTQQVSLSGLLRYGAAGLAGLCLLLVLAMLLAVLCYRLPGFANLSNGQHSSEAQLLDRHGQLLQSIRLDHQKRQLEWIALKQISAPLQNAVLAAEDKRFYAHHGIDLLAVAATLRDNLQRQRARGASTISMQLGKLIDPAVSGARYRWLGKLAQIRTALALELHWSKAQILEAYLNLLPFRGELTGIDAAARGLLNKGPDALDQADASVLAALIREPAASRQRLARRACQTIQSMAAAGSAAGAQSDSAALCQRSAFLASVLPRYPYPIGNADLAPHLARKLLQQPGQKLQVSIDADLQQFARLTLRNQLASLRDQNVEDGALVVLDNASGEVLAYVGSSGDLSGAAEVDGVAALRQPGSTLKPFLYGLAFDQGWLNASSVLDDSPLSLTTPSGLYIPQDYDRDFRGAVSVRTALAGSLNIPAVRTLTVVGVDRFLTLLQQLGMNNINREADHYGFGLALGAAETSLLQLSNAYRTLANQGRWREIRYTPAKADTARPDDSRMVLTPQSSFIVADILADATARSTTFGFSSALSTPVWSAVKTGTSKAMRDNWAVGFSQRYTVGVWVGNFSGAPMWDVSGVTGAAPVWRDMIAYLHRDRASMPPSPPAGVSRQQISYQPPIEASREEWQINHGHQLPAQQLIQIAAARPGLIAPADSAIIAPDPDIPQSRQKLLLQAEGQAGHCLQLDHKPVARCGQLKVLVALPAPGRHVLSLHDSKGQLIASHQFQVRPLPASTARAVHGPVTDRP